MITVHTIRELREQVREARQQGRRIGFVPTMGNLHDGHISLVNNARQRECFVVASIFVNPLQFDDPDDLARYPRTLDQDQNMLAAAGCDLLFAPDVNEMYPEGQDRQTIIHVPEVSEGLCGGSRPGHFDGVATVVNKLFNMVQPDMAFFGEKDFQQVAVIKKMVADLCMPVEIVPVAIKRADDGLALSSRNGYLTEQEREQAKGLYQTLQEIADDFRAHKDIEQTLKTARERLDQRGFRTDYLEIRRTSDLAPATAEDDSVVILGAAYIGKARLIDNLLIDNLTITLNP
ncbi:MAG: pantoate--beta-alanine ligase [Oceanospirillaceae bacterium]|nr:pantoate--beta-alanine ligase [Oceanospirillaceae bacterium]MBT10818.1 pantoate--beta-alanine ligase [Oceanospirillaceae bacterium]|tara:strand:- start:28099 stop:28965 length:867 start_codon:yes stop_codon:yes gene_type:complete